MKPRQFELTPLPHWRHRFSSGGSLRATRQGRFARPLSYREPLHVVLKVNSKALAGRSLRQPKTFSMMSRTLHRYAKRFLIRIDQVSIQKDHVHLLVRGSKRFLLQAFLRVVPGQFAQIFTKAFHQKYEGERIWKQRPFTRVLQGYRSYRIVQDYIQLNEKEAQGQRPYRSLRLRGLSKEQIEELWE